MYSLAGEMKLLERELAAAKAEASHYMTVAQKATDELIFFRADNLKAHQMTCSAGLERDSLRAEVERLKEQLRIESAASAHALHWAEKAEAALHALRLVCGTSDADKFTTWLNVEIAKREQAEAARDRADAEVAALKKVLLQFGQLPSTPP
jgi:hypothetical protein